MDANDPGSEWTVIHVLTHSSLRRDVVEQNFRDGWHAKLGRAIAANSKYDVECWTVDYDRTDTREELIDGIPYRQFPSRLVPGTTHEVFGPYIGSAKPGVEVSIPLIRALRQRAQSGNVAIHLHSDTYLNTYLVAGLFRSTPSFLQHHGGLAGAPRIEQRAFSALNHAFVLTPEKREYMIERVGMPPDAVSVRTMGVDVTTYSPRDITPRDIGYDTSKLLVYVGKFDEYKGLDRVLNAFGVLTERYDVELVLLNGQEDDDLYDRAVATAGVHPVTEYLPADELVDIYSAADAYVSYPVAHSLRSGDCGIIAPAEALACETPVVSPVLRFVPERLRSEIGRYPEDSATFADAITEVLDGAIDPHRCREVAIEQFGWERVAADVRAVYDNVLV